VFSDIADATAGVGTGIGRTAKGIGTSAIHPGTIADNVSAAYAEGGLGLAINQFNPVYGAITSYDKMLYLTQLGCTKEASAAGWDGAFNAASTVAIATGGASTITRTTTGSTATAARAGANSVDSLLVNKDFQFPGAGRSGAGVKDFVGPPSAIVRGAAPGRIYVTDGNGRVILDVTKDRVKTVIPGQGFEKGDKRKIVPSRKQLGWIDELWGG
jgi:hypothetical protein